MPDGRIGKPFPCEVLGTSGKFAIIYKKEGVEEMLRQGHWALSAPVGYSCGSCVEAPPGETFDSFEKVDCGKVKIAVPPTESCNWT